MSTQCKSKNPSTCRYHGTASPAEIEHLAKEELFQSGLVAVNDEDCLFSSEVTERTAFLKTRTYMLGTDNSWEISPEGYTGANCKCGAYLTRDQTKTLTYASIKCKVCNKRIDGFEDLGPTNISHSSKQFLDDSTTLNATWYHITTDPEWASNVSGSADLPVVHVGTKNAAEDRLTMISDDLHYDAKVFMYEVKLKQGTELLSEVHGDGNDYQPKFAADRHPTERNKVARYVNSWEDAGSISLTLEGNMFDVINRKEINPHE
jgi:hypothetical protein